MNAVRPWLLLLKAIAMNNCSRGLCEDSRSIELKRIDVAPPNVAWAAEPSKSWFASPSRNSSPSPVS